MFSTFTAVFEALDSLEKELHNGVDDQEKAKIEETLLSLRNTMDRCVHYWIQFEERVASLQEKHHLELPDNLPESFLDSITPIEEPGEEPEELEKSTSVSSDFPFQEGSESPKPDKIEEFKRSLQSTFHRLSDEKAVISFRKGLGFWDLAMIEEAAREFQKVTESEPDFITGHFFLGLACNYQGDYEKACKELKLVIALDSDSLLKALAHNTLGSIYANEKKYEAALEHFDKAIGLKKELKEAYFNRGALYYCKKDYPKAMTSFNMYLQYDPHDWETLLYAGKAAANLENWEEALDYLEKAYAIKPHEPRITFEMGIVYRLLEKHHKAAFYLHSTKRLVRDSTI